MLPQQHIVHKIDVVYMYFYLINSVMQRRYSVIPEIKQYLSELVWWQNEIYILAPKHSWSEIISCTFGFDY